MVVPDFDTSHNRECMECHRTGFDEGDWLFMGWDDEAKLYICPVCQSVFVPTDDNLLESSVSPTPREVETPIRKASSEAIYHECGTCGVPRFEHGGVLEACPNCGDDETDLSLMDDIP